MTIDPLVPVGGGQTPLSAEDLDGLLLAYISTRGELHEAEQRAIARALVRERPTLDALLDDGYLRDLHRRMFADVWEWAGRYRRTETSIGVAPEAIAASVRDVVRDVRAWIEASTYGADEIAVRFHHRLVSVHPFRNGNGRHSRIAADLLVVELGEQRLTWGSDLDVPTDELRRRYLSALRTADTGDLGPLVSFART
ncbi:MAG: mobile mystery protein B [Acidimicrobiia bacterium]|jgi:Fic-DOC domain mobile mystery protein B